MMKQKISIGLSYEETRAQLRKSIMENTIDAVVQPADGHACYFCLQSVEGNVIVLTQHEQIAGREAETKYFIDEACHHAAQQLFYDGEFQHSKN
ncbi:MAG: hypothetical protein V1725_02650 [archaeon]